MAQAGATRGSKSVDGTVKSMVRVHVQPGHEAEVAGWDTEHVKDTCNMLLAGDMVKVLGGICGTDVQIEDAFEDMCKQVGELHRTTDNVQDAFASYDAADIPKRPSKQMVAMSTMENMPAFRCPPSRGKHQYGLVVVTSHSSDIFVAESEGFCFRRRPWCTSAFDGN